MIYRIKGALLIGIFATSIISWPRPTAVTYFPHTPAGDDLFAFFKQIVTFHPLQHIGNALDVSVIYRIPMLQGTDIEAIQYNYGKGKVWCVSLIAFFTVMPS